MRPLGSRWIRPIVIIILALILLSSVNTYFNLKLFPGQSGGLNYPANPFYNPSSGFTLFPYSYRSFAQGGALITGSTNYNIGQTIFSAPGIYSVNQGSLQIPIGMVGDSFTFSSSPGLFTPSQILAGWTVKLPGGISDACTGQPTTGPCTDSTGFDLKGGVSGTPILLTSATPVGDPTCTNYNGGQPDPKNTGQSACWAADYAIVQQAQTLNPSCNPGATACIFNTPKITNTSNATLVDPAINGVQYNQFNCPNIPGAILSNGHCIVSQIGAQFTQKAWYLYRMITSLTLQIVPPNIIPACTVTGNNPWGGLFSGPAPTCSNLGSGSPVVCSPFLGKCNADPTVQMNMKMIADEINKADVLTNTRIGFGISVTGLAVLTCSSTDLSNGDCWYGIIGAWIGGQGIQTSGCSATGSTCSFDPTGQPHAQLFLFQDPQLTLPATLPLPNQLTGIATLTNQTTAQVISKNVYSQVFTYINTQSLGVQYTYNAAQCSSTNLPGCLTTPTPLVINVPIVFDILGTKSLANWLYQYPGIPPNGGQLAGGIFGTVKDTSGNPVAGACVGIGGICTGLVGQQQKTTDTNGRYSFVNLPAGPYALYVSASGFQTGFQTGINVVVGGSIQADFTLSALPSSGQWCLIPSFPNPIPFQPPTPPFLCIPNIPGWVLPAVIALTGLGLVAFIFTTPGGSALGIAGGSLIRSRVRRRRK